MIYHRIDWHQIAFGVEANIAFEFVRLFIGPLTVTWTWARIDHD